MNKRIVFAVALLCMASLVRGTSQPPSPAAPAIEQRVDGLLKQMSLDDKLKLLGGEDIFFMHAVPGISLPRLKMSDGPVGVRVFGPSTAYPATIALAATWDTEMARRVGEALGEDARARGVHFLLGPGVNMYRASVNGRNMEYMGEDPYLAGRLAVSYIEGVQSKGVVATVKHFAANNSEYDRHNANAIVDERTLRELYLPAFEMAVKEAHVGAVMDAYGLLNGEHLTQNGHMNIDILKKEWGFDGILMSDWEATYDGVAAANAGLDLEMPSAQFMSAKTLSEALADGRVNMTTIDDKVKRILRTAIRFGFLDREQTNRSLSSMNPYSGKVALDEALESAVLLKNEGHLLPLDLKRQKKIVVIGPNAFPAVVGGSGSSQTTPFIADSIASGVSQYVGKQGTVTYIAGLPSLRDVVDQTRFQSMTRRMYAGDAMQGPPISSTNVDNIDGYRQDGQPSGSKPGDCHPCTFVWEGKYEAKTNGKFILTAIAPVDAQYTVTVDGKAAIKEGKRSGWAFPASATISLTQSDSVAVKVSGTFETSAPRISVGLQPVNQLLTKDESQTVAEADAVVLAIGMNNDYEGEDHDRPFHLPWGQEELLDRVLALNPRTVVDIQSGGAVDARTWADRVPALIQSWYPGQSGGTAFARILFGETSPEGKLPMSWERTLDENPAFAHYYEEPGPGNRVTYAEGMNLGYRYYTSQHKQPMFPFGFGLSYTTFSLSGLKVTKTDDDHVVVSLDVKNTGRQRGAEVVQLYVSDPSARIQRPAEELKGFAKVRLDPGQTQRIAIPLDRRSFSYYDVDAHDWRLDPGKFEILVGTSSVNIPLRESVILGM